MLQQHQCTAPLKSTVAWQTGEDGSQFVDIAEVCGSSWWKAFEGIVAAINCSHCREGAEALLMAMHDVVNYKLEKAIFNQENLRMVAEYYQMAADGVTAPAQAQAFAQDFHWSDWLLHVASVQRCTNVPEHSLDKLINGEMIPFEQAEELDNWMACLEENALLIPLTDALEGAREELRGQENSDNVLAEYESLLETHEADVCTPFIWLAKRTGRFRERATLTLSQYKRLTGKGNPGPGNLLKGKLVAWEFATDEKANELGLSTDEFQDCVLTAYERQFALFDLLDSVFGGRQNVVYHPNGNTNGVNDHNAAQTRPWSLQSYESWTMPLHQERNQGETLLQLQGSPFCGQVLEDATAQVLRATDTCEFVTADQRELAAFFDPDPGFIGDPAEWIN